MKLQWFPTCPVSQDFFFARFPHFETSLSESITRPGNAKLFATFLVCFFVGRLGLGSGFSGKPLIPNWNATPAGTVAYLIFQGGNKAGSIVFFFFVSDSLTSPQVVPPFVELSALLWNRRIRCRARFLEVSANCV